MAGSSSAFDGFRSDVEGLRGLAVLVVVLFHAGLGGVIGGFVGVDVFFVISGFLITGLLVREHERTGRIGLLHFYARRVRRLLPAAVVVLIATLVVGFQLVAPLDRPSVGLDAAAAALSIGNIRFAVAAGDYFTSVATPSPFLHFWSLAVEEQFYLVWPALILIVARGVHARRRVMIALLAVFAASFAANLLVTDAAANWAFYSLPTRAWELGLGGLLAIGSGALARIPGRLVGLAGWTGLAAIGVAALTFDSGLPYPGAAALLPSLGAVALIAGGSRAMGPGWLLSLRPLRYVGRVSYSLYLVHWPIFVLAPLAMGGALDDVTRAGLVGLSIAAAVACWALIETPFRTGLPFLARRPGRTLSFGLAAIVAVVVLAAGPSLGVTVVPSVAAADSAATASADPTDESWADETAAPATAVGGEPSLAAASSAPATTSVPTADPAMADPPSAPPSVMPARSTTQSPATVPAAAPTPATATPVAQPLAIDVKPALADARADEDRLRRDHCLASESATEPPDCVYGNKAGTFTVALVGDSHAAHWFPALERLASHEGWRLVTFVKVSCPFIDMRVRNLWLKREYRECATFNNAVIARLQVLQQDLTVVSMSRISTHPLVDGDDTVADKGAAVGRMLIQVPGRTALIVDTPDPGRDVPACLSSHQDDIGACAISRATAFGHALGEVDVVAANASGAGLIDLTALICVGQGACPVVVNGMIVYHDESHLTATFSRSLAPALGAAITEVLAQP